MLLVIDDSPRDAYHQEQACHWGPLGKTGGYGGAEPPQQHVQSQSNCGTTSYRNGPGCVLGGFTGGNEGVRGGGALPKAGCTTTTECGVLLRHLLRPSLPLLQGWEPLH